MKNIFTYYERGLAHLREELGEGHVRYGEALILEQRLRDNVARTHHHGDSAVSRADRAQIVDSLNRLTVQETGTSFNELCGFSISMKRPMALIDWLLIRAGLPPDVPLHEKIGNLLMTLLGRIGGDAFAVVTHVSALLTLGGLFAWWLAQSDQCWASDPWICLGILWLGLTILPPIAGFLPQQRETYLRAGFKLTARQRLALWLDKALGAYVGAYLWEIATLLIWLALNYIDQWTDMSTTSRAIFWFVMEGIALTLSFVGVVITTKYWENVLKGRRRVELRGQHFLLGLGFPLIVVPSIMLFALMTLPLWQQWQTGCGIIVAGLLFMAWLSRRDSKGSQMLNIFVGGDTLTVYPQLAEAASRHNLALFVGADLPREVTGVPSRTDLAHELARRHGLDRSLSLTQVAQRLALDGGRLAFTGFIRDKLDKARSPQSFHRHAVELIQTHRIGTIITTAYDNLLDLAFQEMDVTFTRVVHDNDVSLIVPDNPTLIYLYGYAQSAESLVVSKDDHHRLRCDRKEVFNAVCNALRKNVILFLGYNLSDPDFDLLWQEVSSQPDHFPKEAYAVWPGLPETDVQRWRERGIIVLDTVPLGLPDVSLTRPKPIDGTLPLPQVNPSPQLPLTAQERILLQHVHRGSDQVIVEAEFGGGYSGTRVFLTLPIAVDGSRKARKVTKLGSALELRRERDTYAQFVENVLPFRAAQVKEYYEQEDRAGLNYIFVGGGALGQTMDLEKYYRQHIVEQIVETLDDLLDKELGERWYSQAFPLNCLFAAEYGQHLVEYLRLRLRPASPDTFWTDGQSPTTVPGYQQIDVHTIPHQYETVQPDTLVSIEELVVKKIKRGVIKLENPGGQGIILRVESDPGPLGLEVGSTVGVRGQVVYNRRERMEQIVHAAFPGLSLDSESVRLPSCERPYPNPLTTYTRVLGKTLQGSQSYVHGDLHLRNVLVDTAGRGWLIDFARVEKRHNLFDFIKMETYVRSMVLANVSPALSLDDYVQFEEALVSDTLGREERTCPDNSDLRFAYQVIQAIRRIACKYMGPTSDFRNEYLPALFLYCLAVLKYYDEDKLQSTQLTFATACTLGQYILDEGN